MHVSSGPELFPLLSGGGWLTAGVGCPHPQVTALQVRLWLISVCRGGLDEDRALAGFQVVPVPSSGWQREGTFLCYLPWEPGRCR